MAQIVIVAVVVGAVAALIALVFRRNLRWERSVRTSFFMVERKLAHYRHRLVSLFVSDDKREQMEQALRDQTAKKAFTTFGNMKGVMMKLAQIMSFVDEGMSPEVQQELRKLQSAAPPMDWDLIKTVIVDELGDDPWMIFRHFDETPMAAASIGQVHKAQLPGGEWVAVKIQYPGVDDLIESDLKNLAMLLKVVEKSAAMGQYDAEANAAEMAARIREELDYEQEGRNQDEFRTLHEGHEFIRIPKVYWEYTTKRVLVTEFVEGKSFYEFCDIDTPTARNSEVAHKIRTFTMRAIYRHGMFNADPHPGNYIFHEDGTITFLDFGCVKRWSRYTAYNFRIFMRGLMHNDTGPMIEAFRNLGVIDGVAPGDELKACRAMFQMWFDMYPHVQRDEIITLDPSMFPNPREQERPARKDFQDIIVPPDLFYLFRVFAGLQSIVVRLRATANFHRQELDLLDDAEAFDAFVGDRAPPDQSVPVEFAAAYAARDRL